MVKIQLLNMYIWEADVKDKNIIVVDDMIASGQSMIEVAHELKKKGAKTVYLIATFALLTEGPEAFEVAYQNHYFEKLYSTNLSYVPDSIKKHDWYQDVDCSKFLANIISVLNERNPLSSLHSGIEERLNIIKEVKEKK